MPSNRAKELWNSGIPLSGAWLEFAPPELRLEFDSSPDLLQSLAVISETEIRHGVFVISHPNHKERAPAWAA